jgi:hypothetical protein
MGRTAIWISERYWLTMRRKVYTGQASTAPYGLAAK